MKKEKDNLLTWGDAAKIGIALCMPIAMEGAYLGIKNLINSAAENCDCGGEDSPEQDGFIEI